MKYRIAVAGFQHETNTFSPANTELEHFVKADGWPGLTTGDAIFSTFSDLNLPIGGFLNSARGHQISPTVWASAEPYGRVSESAFETISTMIVDRLPAAAECDAVYLDLHGAMVTDRRQDGEGALLQRIREVVGPDTPLVISLDFHANVTPEMVDLSDAITVYRTYPHIDMAETGARAFALLEQLLGLQRRFAKAYRQIPYLIPLVSQHTGSQPCQGLYEQLPELASASVASIDFACGFPYADIYHCGAALVAYGFDQNAVNRAITQSFEAILAAEQSFAPIHLSAKDAVSLALAKSASDRPIVIADAADNSGAGGSSDTTGLLRELIRWQAKNTLLGCLWDPLAANRAHEAGLGTHIELELGGRNGPPGERPIHANFVVQALSGGRFFSTSQMLRGIELQLGPMALLRYRDNGCDILIAVTSERFQCLDQAVFRELGVEPADYAIVAVKSTVHFRADFEPIAKTILVADCPGCCPCDLSTLHYQRLRSNVRCGPKGQVKVLSN